MRMMPFWHKRKYPRFDLKPLVAPVANTFHIVCLTRENDVRILQKLISPAPVQCKVEECRKFVS